MFGRRGWRRLALVASGGMVAFLVARQLQRPKALERPTLRSRPRPFLAPAAGPDPAQCRRMLQAFDVTRCTGHGQIAADGTLRSPVPTEEEEVFCVLIGRKPLAVVHRMTERAAGAAASCGDAARVRRAPQQAGPALVYLAPAAADASVAGELLEVLGAWPPSRQALAAPPGPRDETPPHPAPAAGSPGSAGSTREGGPRGHEEPHNCDLGAVLRQLLARLNRAAPTGEHRTRGAGEGAGQPDQVPQGVEPGPGERAYGITEMQAHVALGVLLGYPREDIAGMHRMLRELQQPAGATHVDGGPSAPSADDFERDHSKAMAWLRDRRQVASERQTSGTP